MSAVQTKWFNAENESLKDELRSQASYLTSFKKEISKLFSKSQSNKDENNENESEIRDDSESGNMNKCEKCDFIGKTEGGLGRGQKKIKKIMEFSK